VEICIKYNLYKLLYIQAHSLMSGSETLIVMKWTYEDQYCNVSVVTLAVKDQGDMLDGIHKMMDDEVKVKRVRQRTCVCLPVYLCIPECQPTCLTGSVWIVRIRK